ncbi:MAG TPA: MFS transporter [Arthrobacter sp.]|jgi:MFS family permease
MPELDVVKQEKTKPSETSRSALARYVLAATVARAADSAAAVAVVLMVLSPKTNVSNPGLAAGILSACLTAPHLLGPLLGRRLDLARNGWNVIAAACLIYGTAVAAAAIALGRTPLWGTGLLLIIAGASGPLLTGGFSSRLPALVRVDQRSQRRAQGWDATTYGVGGTVGPAAAAAVSGVASPMIAILAVAAAALLAAVLTMTLPRVSTRGAAPQGSVPSPAQVLRLIAGTGALRRTVYVTMALAMPGAAISIAAVGMAPRLEINAANAALLTAAFGLGSLAGSMALMIAPLRGPAEKAVIRLAAAAGVAFALAALVPSFPYALVAFGVAGVLNSLFFTATLASRAEYAPDNARAQAFIWTAALKVTAAAVGTALAGALISLDARLPLIAGGALAIAAAAAASVESRGASRPATRDNG